MKKTLLISLLAGSIFCVAPIFAQTKSLTDADAKAAADKLYVKSDTFADTVAKTRVEYAKWAAEQKKLAAEDVEFSPWIASRFVDAGRENIISEIDPSKNPIDINAVFAGEKLWSSADIKDCALFNMQKFNPIFENNSVYFLAREITAKRDTKIAMTFSHMQNATVSLNGNTVYENKKDSWSAQPLTVIPLDLKAGKNILSIRFATRGDKTVKTIYFAPYADAAKFLAEKIRGDFQHVSDSVKNLSAFSNVQILPSLFASQDNRGALSSAVDAHFWPSDFVSFPLDNIIEQSMFSAGDIEKRAKKIAGDASEKSFVERVKIFEDAVNAFTIESTLGYDIKNLRKAMEDIARENSDYDKSLFEDLKKFESRMDAIKAGVLKNDSAALEEVAQFRAFAAKAMLANPLLKNHKDWVFVKRDSKTRSLGLPQNWQGNTTLLYGTKPNQTSFKDELWQMDITNPESAKMIFKPAQDSAVMDLDVSYDGNKILYSTVDEKNRWQIDEFDRTSGKVRQMTPRIHDSIDNYDGVYLPDGRIVYCSTACFVGVPCVTGSDYVANLYSLNPDAGTPEEVDGTIRQLTFEQDADWMPIVMDNGRILYTRWEYTDNSHYFARILMHMNPDGTAQSSFYGSTSYWPNSLFYCRPIPNDPNKFIGIVTGHHGVARMGELHMFDVSKGRVEESGRVHKFPSYGREYKAEIIDQLVNGKWPQILHPYPISEKLIVASVKLSPSSNWGIYLIDKFDNMTLIKEMPKSVLFEPMPIAPRQKPADVMDKTDQDSQYGHVFLNDIYQGNGLKDVPRGTVKALRVFEYYYCYRNIGGHDVIGNEGSWDVKRIHGTVPVSEDGSAMFKVPANRPIAIQPLDKDGKAIALMRSWFTVMPGEVESCVGCHEGQGMSPTSKPALAARKKPADIEEFISGVRGYSFVRDVQPVLDKYCVGCHDGQKPNRPNFARGGAVWRNFPQAYLDLHPYVRRSGPESNQHMLTPMEFNADTSELIQILKKGHKGVELDAQSMKILTTWIDLNVPCFGTWGEVYKNIPNNNVELRKKYLAKYANRHDDPEKITYDGGVQQFQKPKPAKKHPTADLKADGFPFDAAKAKQLQSSAKLPQNLKIDLPNGTILRLTLIPAGSFVMGSNNGFYDEGPASVQKIDKPFYMGQFEVTNAQFNAFDKNHFSGHLDRHWKDHINKGYPACEPDQSVIRINWNQAQSFCKWLSEKTGVKVSLPTEKQWEWAARGGSDTDFWFGKRGDNYGAFENFADAQTKKFAVNGIDPQPRINPDKYLAFVPCDADVDDGNLVMANVGSYKANPFGLYDILGNVSEWTADNYTEVLGGKVVEDKKVVRGGSWHDRAKRSRVTFRRDYHPWQKVYNVGMRIVIDDAAAAAKKLTPTESLADIEITRNTVPLKDTVGVKNKK